MRQSRGECNNQRQSSALADGKRNGDCKMDAERSSLKFWTRLLGWLLVLSLAPLSASALAIGAEAAPEVKAAAVAPEAPSSGSANPTAAAPAEPQEPSAAERAWTSPLKPPKGYVKNSTCVHCHEVEGANFAKTNMGHLMIRKPRDEQEGYGCQACHGAGREHVRHPHKPAPGFLGFRETGFDLGKTANERCLQCHQNGERAFWQASTHAFRNIRCVDCHQVMCPVTATQQPAPQLKTSPLRTEFVTPFLVTRPETQVCLRCHLRKAMEINLPAHMPVREGLMVCTDCHNPHGGPYPKQLRAATVNELCYRCHAEKRGPFLWLHAPVMMNCLDCHTPHGSINQHMLTIREPLLCQRCHVTTRHPSTPQKKFAVFVFGQSCTNCHSQIHGSNSPGGRVFTR